MSKNKIIVASAGLTAIIAVIGLAAASYAAGGRGMKIGFSPKFSEENIEIRQEMMEKAKISREALEKALENNDYIAWKTLMEEKRGEMAKRIEEFSARINEDTFARQVEIRKLMNEGKYEEANELRKEAGCDLGFGFGPGRGLKAGWNK
ncbi:MAG: hypothetical protein PHQ42_01735 [Patescibacteria group bacterium]|nr:hypothetical protein [Patescibacteria group bacterium]